MDLYPAHHILEEQRQLPEVGMRVETAQIAVFQRRNRHRGIVRPAHMADVTGLVLGEKVRIGEVQRLTEAAQQRVLEAGTLLPPRLHEVSEPGQYLLR